MEIRVVALVVFLEGGAGFCFLRQGGVVFVGGGGGGG